MSLNRIIYTLAQNTNHKKIIWSSDRRLFSLPTSLRFCATSESSSPPRNKFHTEIQWWPQGLQSIPIYFKISNSHFLSDIYTKFRLSDFDSVETLQRPKIPDLKLQRWITLQLIDATVITIEYGENYIIEGESNAPCDIHKIQNDQTDNLLVHILV